MGERIRDLTKFKIGNTQFKIELNSSYHHTDRYDIHLQCDNGRIGLTDREFIQLATCFMLAKKQFLQYKQGDEHHE